MTREELERRVCRVRQELEEAAGSRWPVPKLIVVTKTHSAEEILPLKEIGVTEIGENRVQELKGKLPELQGHFGIHLIGRLQRNKVRQIIHDVCMIQSVAIACNDKTVFYNASNPELSNCYDNPGNLYFEWNARSEKGRVVGTGAYITKMKVKITSGPEKAGSSDDTYTIGIRRSKKF